MRRLLRRSHPRSSRRREAGPGDEAARNAGRRRTFLPEHGQPRGRRLHEIRERATFGSGFAVGASPRFRVIADGTPSEKTHYAMQAAELEADALA